MSKFNIPNEVDVKHAEESDEEDYSDMPPLIPVENEQSDEEDYSDMPPLIPAQSIQHPLYDQFVDSLQIGDTFKTFANYYIIYRGKHESMDLYNVEIINLTTNHVENSYYSKQGIYISLSPHEKINQTG